LLLLGALTLGGCGSGTSATTQTETVTVEASAATPALTSATPPKIGRVPSQFAHCDANVSAKKSTTTCAFAENVFYAYAVSDKSDGEIRAYSPARRKPFTLRCTDTGGHIRCATFVGGVVKFPASAVAAYSQAQADAYAAAHDVGPQSLYGAATRSETPPASPTPSPNVPPADVEPSSDGGCDPNYSGCVPAGIGDVDCGELSETNIQVLGSDPDGLDADGDGIGCES
jgi:hypothetical protein